MKEKLKVISVFSGIGAQERGLEELGIDYEEDGETPCCKVDSSEFNDPEDSKPLSERCCYEE